MKSTVEPLNVAIVGCGALARGQHLPNLSTATAVRLHTCCDILPGVAAEAAERFGAIHSTTDFREAVKDPSVRIVLIATTEKIRLPIIEAAAAAGKAIYCEKPIALSANELYEIQKIVQSSGVPFCAGHNRRSSPAMIEAHRIFRRHMDQPSRCAWRWEREPSDHVVPDDGTAGMSVRINDDWHSWKRWALDPTHAPHGPLLFEMTHFTDLCNWFMDADPVEVSAVSSGTFNHSTSIRYRTGELATTIMCANGTFGYPKELYECFGNGGAVVVDHLVEIRTAGVADAPARIIFPMMGDRDPAVGTEMGSSGWLAKKRAACDRATASGNPLDQFTAEPDKGHARALEHFASEVRKTGGAVCGIESAVLATEVAFAAVKSVQERRTVSLDEIRSQTRKRVTVNTGRHSLQLATRPTTSLVAPGDKS